MTKQQNSPKGITREEVLKNGEYLGFAEYAYGPSQFWRYRKLIFVETCDKQGMRSNWFGGKPSTIAKTYSIKFQTPHTRNNKALKTQIQSTALEVATL